MDTLPDFPPIISEDQPTIGVYGRYQVYTQENPTTKAQRYRLRYGDEREARIWHGGESDGFATRWSWPFISVRFPTKLVLEHQHQYEHVPWTHKWTCCESSRSAICFVLCIIATWGIKMRPGSLFSRWSMSVMIFGRVSIIAVDSFLEKSLIAGFWGW